MRRLLVVLSLLVGFAPAIIRAQENASPPAAETLVHATAAPVSLKAGGTAEAIVHVEVQSGWHINANPPSPDYMLPTVVELTAAHGVRAGKAAYPAGQKLKVGFDEHPLAVFTGAFDVRVPVTAATDAAGGTLQGKVKFQSCNDQLCLTPASVPFTVAVTVTGATKAPPPAGSAASNGAGATSAHATGAGGSGAGGAPTAAGNARTDSRTVARGATAPAPALVRGPNVPPSPALDNPLGRALERGGWLAFLTLFLIGLALNLTPCVYPMLGVTVSIFGAQRAVATPVVVLTALTYVLGMAVMYSTLGVVAALTGTLFGGFLQSPWVLAGIGVLLIVLSLSMFGLYELNPPPQLLNMLGGARGTSLLGAFLSGLVVGVFAAPCIGPPVVALLAIVGAKGDPWFGFRSFFTLALGLGAPYLVLGTFSNLLQRMPRSGMWMVWVKKVFGVILVAVGSFYIAVALAPKLATWIAPAALVLGGIYLGFVEQSHRGRGFRTLKWGAGAAAVIGGIAIVLATPARGIEFQPYTPESYARALAQGRRVMLDFSADWCVPCHELERSTFSDPRVIARAQNFQTFRVDLTHSDSPEVEQVRKQFDIRGVPTVVFMNADGSEVRAARVESFLAPHDFLARMELAGRGGLHAGS